jgi:hypothetical protein
MALVGNPINDDTRFKNSEITWKPTPMISDVLRLRTEELVEGMEMSSVCYEERMLRSLKKNYSGTFPPGSSRTGLLHGSSTMSVIVSVCLHVS